MERSEIIFYILVVFASWFILLYMLKKIGKKYGLEASFPLLIWKTEKGKNLIDRISKKFDWKYYGNISILICILAMTITTYLILRNAIISFSLPVERAPSPRLMLGIPGINPIIPVGYGVIALAIAMVIHEFSHGILARYGGIKIKSLGLIFLILPIGAFVEPDEERLKRAKKIKRGRVFASGPTSNIIVAIVCIILLSFLSMNIVAKEEGLIVSNPAFGMERGDIITNIEGSKIKSLKDFQEIEKEMVPGNFYNISNKKIVFGAYINRVEKNYPAEKYGIVEGSIIYEINGNKIKNWSDFYRVMNETKAYQEIEIKYFLNDFRNAIVILENKYNYTHKSEDEGKGFLGISVLGLNDIVIEPNYYKNLLNPLTKSNFGSYLNKFLNFITFPFYGLSPFPEDLAKAFSCTPVFWISYNLIYWIFWLNFALGAFNSLPLLPLDGGYILKDSISFLFSRSKKAEKISSIASKFVSILILFMILSIIFVPYIRLIFSSL
ncbi:MAG: site-2 protease family protein [Thermoplasmatales archaeon]|nr:site-2 protease family protein [Thermoplasmatales archaeon]